MAAKQEIATHSARKKSLDVSKLWMPSDTWVECWTADPRGF